MLAGIDVQKLPANYREWDDLVVPLVDRNLLSPRQLETYLQQYFALYAEYTLRSPPIEKILPLRLPARLSVHEKSEQVNRMHDELIRMVMTPEQQKIFDGNGRQTGYEVRDPLISPQGWDRFDGVDWDMEFDTDRGTWMPGDRIQTEVFRKRWRSQICYPPCPKGAPAHSPGLTAPRATLGEQCTEPTNPNGVSALLLRQESAATPSELRFHADGSPG